MVLTTSSKLYYRREKVSFSVGNDSGKSLVGEEEYVSNKKKVLPCLKIFHLADISFLGVYKLHVCCLSSLYIQVDVTLMAFNKRKKSGRKKHQRVYNSDVGHKLVVLFYFPGGYRSVSSSGIPEKNQFLAGFACVYNPSFCLLYKREERNGRKIMSGVALPLKIFFLPPPAPLLSDGASRISHKSISRSASCNRRRWVYKTIISHEHLGCWVQHTPTNLGYKIIFLCIIQRKLFKQIKTGTVCVHM
jgi:hypothetical protein